MIRPITAAETLAIRWPILRPGFPQETAIFPGDDLPSTCHFGAFDDSARLVGVASIYLAPLSDFPFPESHFQLRGMATLPNVRGAGYGAALVQACVEASQTAGGTLIWCNARTSAAPFYQKHGWQILGDEFDIPTVGPHYRMARQLPSVCPPK
jgi:GNAT superfamily N-acetyltransferase